MSKPYRYVPHGMRHMVVNKMKTSESTHLEDRSFVIKYWVQVNQAW